MSQANWFSYETLRQRVWAKSHTYENSYATEAYQSYATWFIRLTNSFTSTLKPWWLCITLVSRFIVWGCSIFVDTMGEKSPPYHLFITKPLTKGNHLKLLSCWGSIWAVLTCPENMSGCCRHKGLIFACSKQHGKRLFHIHAQSV